MASFEDALESPLEGPVVGCGGSRGSFGSLWGPFWESQGRFGHALESNLCGHAAKEAPWTFPEPVGSPQGRSKPSKNTPKPQENLGFCGIFRKSRVPWKNCLGEPPGRPWGRLGRPWGRLGKPWGRLGRPSGSPGGPWRTLWKARGTPWEALLGETALEGRPRRAKPGCATWACESP